MAGDDDGAKSYCQLLLIQAIKWVSRHPQPCFSENANGDMLLYDKSTMSHVFNAPLFSWAVAHKACGRGGVDLRGQTGISVRRELAGQSEVETRREPDLCWSAHRRACRYARWASEPLSWKR